MKHKEKYIYILLTFILFLGTPAWATIDLGCEDTEQNNPQGQRWSCPDLGNGVNLDATLSDLDVETGQYTCEYRYPDTQQVATVCSYVSVEYKKTLDSELNTTRNDIVKIITQGGSFGGFISNFYNNTIGTGYLPLFNTDTEYQHELSLISNLATEINDGLVNLSAYFNDNNDSNGYLYNHETGNSNHPLKALNDSYTSFVKPYTPKGGTSRNESTFSRFVVGLVTLDKEIVKGYDETNGELVLNTDWENNVSTLTEVINEIKKSFAADNSKNYTINTDKQNINSWISIFKQKIWGFYYNLQRRLDLGYDIISTQLLFIMMVFFSIGMAVRGGARYITNRENGHSSGEIKINEASIMKTLGILATVFTFYISVPYKSDSVVESPANGGTVASNFDGEHDISTNSSLSKLLIRLAMKEGSTFGTMISDLGTDAFLRFIVHQQGLNNGLREGDNVVDSILSMLYYFPAHEVVNACRYQTGLSDDRILSGQGTVAISHAFSQDSISGTTAGKHSFYTNNKITMISDDLCRKMIYETADTLHDVSVDMKSLLAMIENDKFLRMNATFNLLTNHISLQKELGWMNIASIPYTYFMMKNQHLFYESSIDYEKISKTSEQYVKNIGLRGGQDAIDSTLWVKDITKTNSRLANNDKNEEYVKEYTRLAIYNFLPGFSSIRNEVLQRIQGLFSDILRMQRSGSGNANLKPFADFLNNITSRASAYYGKIENLFDIPKMKKQLMEAVGANGGRSKPILLHQLFFQISYLVAMGIWKSGFILVFLSAIAMIIGLKIVLYIINVMVHFFISPFIVIWAFATSPDGGAGKIKNYLRDTLIYMLYPTMIVIGVFMFIFAYELFYNIYGFITSMLIEGQTKVVENAVLTNNIEMTNARMGFLAVYALRDITEILIDLLSVYVAFLTINKFPELVLKMMGVGDSAVIMLPQASEAIQSKGGGNVNPLSR